MSDRSIAIELSVKAAGLVNGFRTATQAAQQYAGQTQTFIQNHEKSMQKIGNASMVGGTAIMAGVGLVVKSYMDFDKQMSEVQSSTHETTGNMNKLREAAIAAGADTSFSAKEAAQGIDELAKAGINTTDILNGGLKGALSLAAAGSLDVGKAAELSASALTQFKLSGDQVPHIADLLAAGAGKAQGSVEDMGMALNQTGLIASQTGLSIEDTTGALALMAKAGLVGSDAGTSMKTMLQRLIPTSKEAKQLTEQYNISAYDQQGAFIGIEKYAQKLKVGLSGLSDEQRANAMTTLFGSDAVRAGAILYEAGAQGVATMRNEVNDLGFAAETARIKQDNLAGDVEKLGGSIDSAFLKSGSNMNTMLRDITKEAEKLVDGIGKMDTKSLQMIVSIAASTGGLLLFGGATIKGVTAVSNFSEGLKKMETSGGKAGKAMAGISKGALIVAAALAAARVAATQFNTEMDKEHPPKSVEAFTNAMKTSKGTAWQTTQEINKAFDNTGSSINGLGGALAAVFDKSARTAGIEWGADILGITTDVDRATTALGSFDDALSQMATEGHGKEAAQQWANLTTIAKGQGITVDELRAKFPKYAAAVTEAATAEGKSVTKKEDLNDAMSKGLKATVASTDAIVKQKKALDDLMDSEQEHTNNVLGQRDAERGFIAAKQDAMKGMAEWRKELVQSRMDAGESQAAASAWFDQLVANGGALDDNTEAGRKNSAALDAVATAGERVIDSMRKQGAGVPELQAAMQKSRDEYIKTATAMGMPIGKATELADELGLIPENIKSTVIVQTNGAGEANARLDQVARERTAKITVWAEMLSGKDSGAGILSGLSALPIKRAAGGPVFGRGTATSDSIPAMLSDGEFVQPTSSVRKYGSKMMEQIRSGTFDPSPQLYRGPTVIVQNAPASSALSTDVQDALLRLAENSGIHITAQGTSAAEVKQELFQAQRVRGRR